MTTLLFQAVGGVGGGNGPIEVEIGTFRECQVEAVAFMGEALRDRPERFLEHDEATVTVSDKKGLVLFTLTLTAGLGGA